MPKLSLIASLLVVLTIVVSIDVALHLGIVGPINISSGRGGDLDFSIPSRENNRSISTLSDSRPDDEDSEYRGVHRQKSLSHVAIIVKDLERSIEFYKRRFGFKLIRKMHAESSPWHLAFLTSGDGDPILELQQYVRQSDEPMPTGFSHLGVFVSDASWFYEASRVDGATWEGSLFESQFGKMGFMIDPDGYRVEIMDKPQAGCMECHLRPHLE